MTHTKPILALGSLGMGVAALLLAAYLQRDRFAFTSGQVRNFDAPTSVKLVPPRQLAATAQPPALTGTELTIPPVTIEAPLPPTPRGKLAPPAAFTEEPELMPAPPPCKPAWRELESGPAGRRVREICPPPAADNVPRS
jgi:hypothetical protein